MSQGPAGPLVPVWPPLPAGALPRRPGPGSPDARPATVWPPLPDGAVRPDPPGARSAGPSDSDVRSDGSSDPADRSDADPLDPAPDAPAGPRGVSSDPTGTDPGAAPVHRGLFGRGLLYVLVMAAPLVSAVVFSPVLTHVLGPTQYGLVALAISLNQLLTAVVLLGLDQAVLVQRAEDGDSVRARGLVASAVVVTVLVMSLVAVTAPWWGEVFGFRGEWAVLWWTLAWSTPAAAAVAMGNLLLAENRLKPFTVFTLVSTTVGQALALACVLLGRPLATVYLAGALGISVVSLLLGTALTRPRWSGVADLATTRRALALGLPMATNAVAGYVLNAGDRVLIQRLLGPAEVGRYQVAYTIGYAVVLLMYYVSQSWTPRFAEVRDAQARLALHETSRNALYRLLAPTVLGVTLAAPVALRVLAPASFEPRTLSIVVALVAIGAFPVAAGGASGRELLTLRRGRPQAAATVVAAVVNIGLNLMLLPRWGIVGAALATLLSFWVQSAVKLAALPRRPRWPRTPVRLWALVVGASALAAASTYVPDTPVSMGVRFGLGLACLPWLWVELRRARV